MFKLFGEKPDHPMYDLNEARRLLAESRADEPAKAIDDLTFWLESIREVPGFRTETRAAIVMLMDEAGRPLHNQMLQQYLSAPHLQDFQGLHLWQGIHAYAKTLAAAYEACVREARQTVSRSAALKELTPLLCVRQLHAATKQMKLELMRYLDVDPAVWRMLCEGYRLAEAEQCAETMVVPYPGHIIHTSPQRELLRALVLDISSPGTLATDQIEVCYRIAGRLVSFFDLKSQPDADCPYRFDLLANSHPQRADGTVTPDTRFFGAVRALPAVLKILDQNENDPVWQQHRTGSEFTPAGKLTVLKHLHTYWSPDPPHRSNERRGISGALDVVHGFRLICQLVTHLDQGHAGVAAQEETAEEERERIALVEAGKAIDYTPETWTVSDVSSDGLGATLTRNVGAWVKIGDLCGLRPQNGPLWWVGMVRRLYSDTGGKAHVGIEILARKPASVWLRALGKGAETASNWETSSGSFKYSYLPVILLPDSQNSYQQATMLMESGSYVQGNIYQVMMGAHSRDIRLTSLLAEGEDYEQVGFEWL